MIQLNDENLKTIMSEVKSVLSNRPLTKFSSYVSDSEAPTSNNLLLLNAGIKSPPGMSKLNDSNLSRRWKQVQCMINIFWFRWEKEHLVCMLKYHLKLWCLVIYKSFYQAIVYCDTR